MNLIQNSSQIIHRHIKHTPLGLIINRYRGVDNVLLLWKVDYHLRFVPRVQPRDRPFPDVTEEGKAD
jgi:hypothetical protein